MLSGVVRLIANLPSSLLRLRSLPTEAPSLHRHYPASSVHYGPLRHPKRPGLALASCQLILSGSSLGLPVLRLVPFAYMPSPLPRQVRRNPFARTIPSSSAFPEIQAGRHLRYPFRGLLSVHSRYGLYARRVAKATLYTEGSNDFVTSIAASIATGWSEPVPGRDYLPLWTSAFSRRTVIA